MALSFSGRFKVMTLTLSSTSYRTTGSGMITPLSLLPVPRQAVDRSEPFAKATDDRNPGLAKVCHLFAAHEPRAGVQQVMRLAAGDCGALKQLEVAPPNLGHLKRLAVGIVAAEHDDVMVGARGEDTKGLRQVDEEGPVAPGVERVPVATDKADTALDLGLHRGRQWREFQAARCGDVENQLGQPAGRGNDPEPAPRRTFRALGRGNRLAEFDEIRDLDCVMGAKKLGRQPGIACHPARMGSYCIMGAFGPSDL